MSLSISRQNDSKKHNQLKEQSLSQALKEQSLSQALKEQSLSQALKEQSLSQALKGKEISLLETLKQIFVQKTQGNSMKGELPLCLICQNRINLGESLATCQCSCRMICHQSCLTAYHKE